MMSYSKPLKHRASSWHSSWTQVVIRALDSVKTLLKTLICRARLHSIHPTKWLMLNRPGRASHLSVALKSPTKAHHLPIFLRLDHPYSKNLHHYRRIWMISSVKYKIRLMLDSKLLIRVRNKSRISSSNKRVRSRRRRLSKSYLKETRD